MQARRGTFSAVERHYFNVFIFSFRSHHTEVLTTARRYFRKMLVAFSSPPIYTKYIKLPRSDDPTPSRIADDPAVHPFFKDAIGAIDSAHIACTPSTPELKRATRNRRGFRSQSCLVGCNFDREFMYVLSGWEGSVADASVYHDARTRSFPTPIGRYYLADAGYPICPRLLIPYRSIRFNRIRPRTDEVPASQLLSSRIRRLTLL